MAVAVGCGGAAAVMMQIAQIRAIHCFVGDALCCKLSDSSVRAHTHRLTPHTKNMLLSVALFSPLSLPHHFSHLL